MLNAAAIRLMAERGLSAADIADIAEAMDTAPTRSSGAERQRRYRERKRACDVTRDVTSDASPGVTNPSPTPPSYTPSKEPPKGGSKGSPGEPISDADCQAVWESWPAVGRGRSSRKKFDPALRKAAKAHGLDAIRAGIAGYLATADATKDGGAFVPAIHRWIGDERYREFARPSASKPAKAELTVPLPEGRVGAALRDVARYHGAAAVNAWFGNCELNGTRIRAPTDFAASTIKQKFGQFLKDVEITVGNA